MRRDETGKIKRNTHRQRKRKGPIKRQIQIR